MSLKLLSTIYVRKSRQIFQLKLHFVSGGMHSVMHATLAVTPGVSDP